MGYAAGDEWNLLILGLAHSTANRLTLSSSSGVDSRNRILLCTVDRKIDSNFVDVGLPYML